MNLLNQNLDFRNDNLLYLLHFNLIVVPIMDIRFCLSLNLLDESKSNIEMVSELVKNITSSKLKMKENDNCLADFLSQSTMKDQDPPIGKIHQLSDQLSHEK